MSRERLGVSRAAKCRERICGEDRLAERRAERLLEPAGEPAQRVPLAARLVAQRDQCGELDGLAEVELADAARLADALELTALVALRDLECGRRTPCAGSLAG
jgi:hypothetical protein